MEQQSLSKYDRVKVTANAHLVFIKDMLTQAVMEMIQTAKNLGIYRHKRKFKINEMFSETGKYERFMHRVSGDTIDDRANQCEAYSEQMRDVMQSLLREAELLLKEQNIPNAEYLAYIHLIRVVNMAADIAIRGWQKKLVELASPKKPDFNMNIFKQGMFNVKLQNLISFEFSDYQDKKKESEETEKATREFLQKMSDTTMICKIMAGEIKASWILEDERKAEEEAKKAEEEEANKTATEAV